MFLVFFFHFFRSFGEKRNSMLLLLLCVFFEFHPMLFILHYIRWFSSGVFFCFDITCGFSFKLAIFFLSLLPTYWYAILCEEYILKRKHVFIFVSLYALEFIIELRQSDFLFAHKVLII